MFPFKGFGRYRSKDFVNLVRKNRTFHRKKNGAQTRRHNASSKNREFRKFLVSKSGFSDVTLPTININKPVRGRYATRSGSPAF